MKKFTIKILKPASYIILILFNFQNCTLYHKNTVSIDQAVNSEVKSIKIITQDDRKLFFDSLYYKNKELYGMLDKPKKDQKSEIRIIPESIKEIHLFNKAASTALTVTFAVGIPAAIIAYGIANFEMDLSGMDFD